MRILSILTLTYWWIGKEKKDVRVAKADSKLDEDDKEKRRAVEMLTQRYQDSAPRWQFVIWLRQFLLFLISILLKTAYDNVIDESVLEGYRSVCARPSRALLIFFDLL